MNKKLRIVYMGTPDFAVPVLDILAQNNYTIVGVITVPDKPAGRGQKLRESAVKQYAAEKGLPVYQPEKLKDPAFLQLLKDELKPDLQIVVAFRMLPKEVWQLPKYGTFNLHASLLPKYRGAAPINWAVINGEKESGVTTFFIEEEIDTGKIILQHKIPIGENETAGELHDRMMIEGAKLVLKTVQSIEKGNISPIEQIRFTDEVEKLKPAPKLNKQMAQIHWDKAAEEIQQLVLGLSPYPTAWTVLFNSNLNKPYNLKVFFSEKELSQHKYSPGSILTDKKSYFKIACKDGFIHLLKVQLEGKKAMSIGDFLRGFRFEDEWLVK